MTSRDVGVVLLVALVSLGVAWKGWKSRLPDLDIVTSVDSAQALWRSGTIPDRGVVSSFGSFVPPGAVWMLIPDVLVSSDARWFGFTASALLHAGTLVGIFLLARRYFGGACGLVAVVLYGLSEIGVTFAMAFANGPRGHPFFYVWMAYWACRWVRLRDAKSLAAALGTWLAGMYVFMELAPAILALAVVWWRYRPPVRSRLVPVVLAAGLIMWSPYLGFQVSRGFVDLRSQLFQQDILPSNYQAAWCDPAVPGFRWTGAAGERLATWNAARADRIRTGLTGRIARKGLAIARGLTSNFEQAVPGTWVVLLGLTLAGMVRLSDPGGRALDRLEAFGHQAYTRWRIGFGVALLASSLILDGSVIGAYLGAGQSLTPFSINSVRILRVIMAIAGVSCLLWRVIVRGLRHLPVESKPALGDPRPLVLTVAVPWLVLLLVAEHGSPARFLFLWPLHMVVLAACLVTIRPRVPWAWACWLIVALTTAAALLLPPALASVEFIRRFGWSGPVAAEVRVVNYLADLIGASGARRAAIGYGVFTDAEWTPRFHVADPRYKIGAQWDLLLRTSHGIENTDVCAEGFSAEDEYRVVQTRLDTGEASGPFVYFGMPMGPQFELLREIGPYRIYRRTSGPAADRSAHRRARR